MAKRKHSDTPVDPAEQPASLPSGQKRNGKPLHVWLDPALRDAIDALAASTRRSITTEVTIAMEKHLREAGLWPPRS